MCGPWGVALRLCWIAVLPASVLHLAPAGRIGLAAGCRPHVLPPIASNPHTLVPFFHTHTLLTPHYRFGLSRPGACLKYTDKWAEREHFGGAREQWGDKWEENFADGRGTKKVGCCVAGWLAGRVDRFLFSED